MKYDYFNRFRNYDLKTVQKIYKKSTWKNINPIDKAIEYSEDAETLKSIIDNYHFYVKNPGHRKYFSDDDTERMSLTIQIDTKNHDKSIEFEYGMSIYDTQTIMFEYRIDRKISKNIMDSLNNPIHKLSIANTQYKSEKLQLSMIKEIQTDLLYSILCCIRLDYYCPDNFLDFCMEFGYDEDSRKAEKTFHHCLEHSYLLRHFFGFSDTELESLPS